MNEKERIIELVRQEILTLDEALELLEAAGDETTELDKEAVDYYSQQYQQAQSDLNAESQEESSTEAKHFEQLQEERQQLETELDKKQEALTIVQQRLRELEVFAELDDLTHEMQDQKAQLQKNETQLELEVETLESQLAEIQLELNELSDEEDEDCDHYWEQWADNIEDFAHDAAHEAARTGRKYQRKMTDGLKEFFQHFQMGDYVDSLTSWAKRGEVIHTLTFDDQDLHALAIDVLNGSLTIQSAPITDMTAQFNVTIYGRVPEISWEGIQDYLFVEAEGNHLTIESKHPRLAVNVLLNVPEDWAFDQVDLRSMNGDLTVIEQTIEDLNLHSTNGEGLITGSTIPMAQLNFVNGNCTIDESEVTTVNYDGVNGDLRWAGAVNSLEAKTVNGNFLITKMTDTKSYLHIANVSGDVKVALPTSVNIEANYSGSTGTLHSRLSNTENPIKNKKQQSLTRYLNEQMPTVELEVTTVAGDLLLKDSND